MSKQIIQFGTLEAFTAEALGEGAVIRVVALDITESVSSQIPGLRTASVGVHVRAINDAGHILACYLPVAQVQLFNGRREGDPTWQQYDEAWEKAKALKKRVTAYLEQVAAEKGFAVRAAGVIDQVNWLHCSFSVLLNAASEIPTTTPMRWEVSLANPVGGFLGMATARPLPEGKENVSFCGDKDALADDVTMIVCPAPNHGIKDRYQFASRDMLMVADSAPYLFQKRLYTSLTWLNNEFIVESANGLSEEIEAVFEVGNVGFRW